MTKPHYDLRADVFRHKLLSKLRPFSCCGFWSPERQAVRRVLQPVSRRVGGRVTCHVRWDAWNQLQ